MSLSDTTDKKPMLGIAAYAFALSLLYEWGYWGSFNINILQYISINDIPRIAAYPLAATFVTYIGLIINAANLRDRTLKLHFVERALNIKHKALKVIIITTYFLAVSAPLFFMKIGGILIFSILIIPVAFDMLDCSGIFQYLFPSIKNKSLLTLLMTILLLLSFAYGKTCAEAILMRSAYSTAKIDAIKDDIVYIGHAGDYIIFTSMDNNNTIYQRANDTKTMVLQKHTNKLTTQQLFRPFPTL